MARHALIYGLLVAGLASPAAAADFTFDVPVSVRDVPLITHIRVDCLVSVLAAGVDGAAAESNIVGRGEVLVEAPGGDYEGTVVVPVENRGGRLSADARSYACSLDGQIRSPTGAISSLGGNWSLSLTRRTGTGLISENTETRGNIP